MNARVGMIARVRRVLLPCVFVLNSSSAYCNDPLQQEFGPVSITVHTAEIPQSFFAPKGSPELTFYGLRSLVIRLEVKVNGTRVVVPLDSFVGLGDPRSIDVSKTSRDGKWRLRLEGGDASSAYCANLDFDKKQVHRVAVYRSCRSSAPFVTKQYTPIEVLN
jgi:hypothetical protein